VLDILALRIIKPSITVKSKSRRNFLTKSAGVAVGIPLLPNFLYAKNISSSKENLSDEILGHGDFKYRAVREWGNLDPASTPVKNCHEMVMDSKGRLIMITDETKNNIIIYDKSGKLVSTWGDSYPSGHGLSIWNADDEDFLFVTDNGGTVDKTTVGGRVIMSLPKPHEIGVYSEEERYVPTETAIGPNGDIYIADGYGSQFILQYDMEGKFIRKFGGRGDEDHQFQTAHGVTLDDRDKDNPTLLCTSRAHNAFKRYSLEGEYLETIFLPGAYVCRAVVDDENVYAGVCWSRLKYLNQTPNSGFVTILNGENKPVSNPGGSRPVVENGELQIMVQTVPIFKHCHDVCIDDDKNIYVCQWNADLSYPIKLERI